MADPAGQNPLQAIEYELDGERAAALGNAGRRLEAAIAALATASAIAREDALDEAGTAVGYYIIIRESLGLYDHDAALALYAVPRDVMARVGVIKPARARQGPWPDRTGRR